MSHRTKVQEKEQDGVKFWMATCNCKMWWFKSGIGDKALADIYARHHRAQGDVAEALDERAIFPACGCSNTKKYVQDLCPHEFGETK